MGAVDTERSAEANSLYQQGCAAVKLPGSFRPPHSSNPYVCARRSLDSRRSAQPDCPRCGACDDYTKILWVAGFARREVTYYCKVRPASSTRPARLPCLMGHNAASAPVVLWLRDFCGV